MTRFTPHALGLVCTLGATAAWAQPPPIEPPIAPAPSAPPVAPVPSTPPASEPVPQTRPEGETAAPPNAPRSNGGSSGMGLSPTALQLGGEASSLAGVDAALSGASLGTKLQVRGYLRAPMRIGYGPPNDGSAGHELHAAPRLADGSYTDWRYTANAPGPWTQLIFSYGNARASGTVIVAASNQTDASFKDLEEQLGINQAFVTLNFPEAFGDAGGLTLTAGAFSNRYGTAGKNNAGKYDTYLFGRTHIAGETLSADLPLTADLHVLLEHGIGAKMDVQGFLIPTLKADFLPSQGPVPYGSTFVHHAHAGVALSKTFKATAHYLTSWTPDDNEPQGTPAQPGRTTVTGAEVKISAGVGGDGYIGFSHVDARHVLPLANGLEVIHSENGSQLKNNYFGRFDPHTGLKPPDDSGRVETLLFQYTLSLGTIARYPARFSGNGPDLTLTTFGMFNVVTSDTNSHKKLKYGGEITYTALPWLGVAGRVDMVQPDLRYRQTSFAVLSPKVILRTAFIANEWVVFEYSRYVLGSIVYPSFPYERLDAADPNLFQIIASMAW